MTGRQAGPMQGSSHRPVLMEIRQDAERGSHWSSSQGEHTSALSHTHALTRVYTYAHMCVHTQVHAHDTHTHTHVYLCNSALTQAPTCTYTLILTYVQVLISGTWLWFSRVNPARLYLSMKHFSSPPHNLPEPGLRVPRPAPGGLPSLRS